MKARVRLITGDVIEQSLCFYNLRNTQRCDTMRSDRRGAILSQPRDFKQLSFAECTLRLLSFRCNSKHASNIVP